MTTRLGGDEATVDLTLPAEVHLPRARAGSDPQFTLSVLLGDYWFERVEPLPAMALVRLLNEFGVSDGGGRQAALRLSRRGILVQHKAGRVTSYGYRPRSSEVTQFHLKRIIGFGSSFPEWDGMWTLVTFSVPENERVARATLRQALRTAGFGLLHDATWVIPRDSVDSARLILDEMAVAEGHVFRASQVPRSDGDAFPADRVFDLPKLRRDYADFIERHEPVANGAKRPENALVYRTTIMSEWLSFRQRDPNLPAELLGADWSRARAHEIFLEIYDSLGPAAERRFQTILAEVAPAVAHLARHHTSRVLNN